MNILKIQLRWTWMALAIFSLKVYAQDARLPVAPKSLTEESVVSEKAGVLGLSQLIKMGLEYSPEVRKVESDLRIAREEFNLAEAQIFPTLNLKASAINRKQALINFGQSGFVRQNLYSAALELSQPLYAGGAITSGLTAAKLARDIAQQKLFVEKQNYLSSLIATYYDYSEAVERLRQAEINRDFLINYAKIARQYASIGRTKSIDRLQAEANLASAESAVLEHESLAETARNRLLQVIGAQDLENKDLKIQTQLVIKPIEPLTYQDALKKAEENNPVLKQAELELRRQDYINDLTLVEDRPRLSLDGSYGYISPTREEWFVEQRNNYTVGVNLVIPIFSGLSSFAKRRTNTQLALQREHDLNLVRDQLRQSLNSAIQVLDRDFRRVKNLKEATDLGQRAMNSALRDYQRGLVSSTDVIAIQNNRFQSEVELLRVSSSYMKQVLSLRRDLGIELEKAYTQ